MVSDVAELTRILRQPTGSRSNGLRARLREMTGQIRAELAANGQAIFTDEHGNRYLIRQNGPHGESGEL